MIIKTLKYFFYILIGISIIVAYSILLVELAENGYYLSFFLFIIFLILYLAYDLARKEHKNE